MGASATATLGGPEMFPDILLTSAIQAPLSGCAPHPCWRRLNVARASAFVLILDLDLDINSVRLCDRSWRALRAALSQTSSLCSHDKNLSSGRGYHEGRMTGAVTDASY